MKTNAKKWSDLVGKCFKNGSGDTLKVIKVTNYNNVLIEYQDKHKYRYTITKYNLLEGLNKNPYRPSVKGIGYLGVGRFTTKCGPYRVWANLITNHQHKVDKRWHNYQVFSEWYVENRPEHTKLKTTNGLYSPESTVFVRRFKC